MQNFDTEEISTCNILIPNTINYIVVVILPSAFTMTLEFWCKSKDFNMVLDQSRFNSHRRVFKNRI